MLYLLENQDKLVGCTSYCDELILINHGNIQIKGKPAIFLVSQKVLNGSKFMFYLFL